MTEIFEEGWQPGQLQWIRVRDQGAENSYHGLDEEMLEAIAIKHSFNVEKFKATIKNRDPFSKGLVIDAEKYREKD